MNTKMNTTIKYINKDGKEIIYQYNIDKKKYYTYKRKYPKKEKDYKPLIRKQLRTLDPKQCKAIYDYINNNIV